MTRPPIAPATALAAALALGPSLAAADTFVLVHGAFQGAAGWAPVAAALTAAGHEVVAVDLPGRDATGAAAQAVTLDAYVAAVRGAVEAAGEPVVLVGHSFGGFTISAVAEAVPDRIERLVYVAAYVPASGESMQALAATDRNAWAPETFVVAPDFSSAGIRLEDQVRVFAQDADPAQAEALLASMVREPLGPLATPVTLTPEAFGAVDKAYVRTTADGTVSPELQGRMIERAGVTRVAEIPTGHAPFLTQPEALAAILDDLAD